MTIRQLTPPESEPVTLEQAKGFVRVDTDADDALLSLLITAARQEAEAITGRALGESTWAVSLPSLSGMLEVPLVPCTELVGAAVDGMAVKPEQYGFVPSGMALRAVRLHAVRPVAAGIAAAGGLHPRPGFSAGGNRADGEGGLSRREVPGTDPPVDAGADRDAVRTAGELRRGVELQ